MAMQRKATVQATLVGCIAILLWGLISPSNHVCGSYTAISIDGDLFFPCFWNHADKVVSLRPVDSHDC